MLVTTPEKDILEMNVQFDARTDLHYITVRKGGHIQRLTNTASKSRHIASKMLVEVAEELRTGVSVIGSENGRPYLKTEIGCLGIVSGGVV